MKSLQESIVSSVGAGKEKIIKNLLKKIEKQTNTYYKSTAEHKFDEWGNEIGDSIDLRPADYTLDAVDRYEYILTEIDTFKN